MSFWFRWLLFCAAMYFWASTIGMVSVYNEVKNWEPTKASLEYKDTTNFVCQFSYSYVVDGKKYHGDRSNTLLDQDQEICAHLAKAEASGTLLTFYDPANPSRSILDNRLQHSRFADLISSAWLCSYFALMYIDFDFGNRGSLFDRPPVFNFYGLVNVLSCLAMLWSCIQPSYEEGPLISYFLQAFFYGVCGYLSFSAFNRQIAPEIYGAFTLVSIVLIIFTGYLDEKIGFSQFLNFDTIATKAKEYLGFRVSHN